jgi:hypothetical protein
MLPSREELLAKAAALPEPPVAFEACWDGDTTGWFVILYAILSGQRCHYLAFLRGGSDMRILAGAVPPWPEAKFAQAVGTELAERYGVPFNFASPDRPELGHVPPHTRTPDEEARMAQDRERYLERVEQLREYGLTHRPSEVLALLISLVPDLESSDFIFHFKKAFHPHVPLQACIEAQCPAQVFGERGISDEEFDAIFAPYWSKVQSN